MVYVLHNEQNQIIGFSNSVPKDTRRYFHIDLGTAGLFESRVRRLGGPTLLEYDFNHQAFRLRRMMEVDEDLFVQVGAGRISLIAKATMNLEEAQRDVEVLNRARKLEEEGKIEESLSLEEPVLEKYQSY